MKISLSPIGYVKGGRTINADDQWGDVESCIVLEARFDPECLMGLDAFSHALIVYQFDRVQPEKIETSARHPRNNKEWPRVGIFSQRGKNRPNQLGVSTCRILKVDALTVHVKGLDALDGTPVLDIKPVFREFQVPEPIQQPDWAAEIMRSYWEQH